MQSSNLCHRLFHLLFCGFTCITDRHRKRDNLFLNFLDGAFGRSCINLVYPSCDNYSGAVCNTHCAGVSFGNANRSSSINRPWGDGCPTIPNFLFQIEGTYGWCRRFFWWNVYRHRNLLARDWDRRDNNIGAFPSGSNGLYRTCLRHTLRRIWCRRCGYGMSGHQ